MLNFFRATRKNRLTRMIVESTCTISLAKVFRLDDIFILASPKKIKGKFLQLFFTTKKGTQVTGLGSFVNARYLKAHGGELTIGTEKNEFSIFKINLHD